MTVLVDGIEQYKWPVSIGRLGYSTPSGTYTPTSMNEIWYSKQWDNSPMPHSIFFMKDGHAIHGSYEVKTSRQTRLAWLRAHLAGECSHSLCPGQGKETGGIPKSSSPAPRRAVRRKWHLSQPTRAMGARLRGLRTGQNYYPPPRRGFFGRCSSRMTVLKAITSPAAIIPKAISPCCGLPSAPLPEARGEAVFAAGIIAIGLSALVGAVGWMQARPTRRRIEGAAGARDS